MARMRVTNGRQFCRTKDAVAHPSNLSGRRLPVEVPVPGALVHIKVTLRVAIREPDGVQTSQDHLTKNENFPRSHVIT